MQPGFRLCGPQQVLSPTGLACTFDADDVALFWREADAISAGP